MHDQGSFQNGTLKDDNMEYEYNNECLYARTQKDPILNLLLSQYDVIDGTLMNVIRPKNIQVHNRFVCHLHYTISRINCVNFINCVINY